MNITEHVDFRSLITDDVVALSTFEQRLKIGIDTGNVWLDDYYGFENRTVYLKIESDERWTDYGNGQQASQVIKYYPDDDVLYWLKTFMFQFPNKLLHDLKKHHFLIDTIRLGRCIKYLKSIDSTVFTKSMYGAIVWNVAIRKQKCLVCTNEIIGLGKLDDTRFITAYDLVLSTPRESALPKKAAFDPPVKWCVWSKDHNVPDFIEFSEEFDVCYHYKQEFGHSHYHRYLKLEENKSLVFIKITSTNMLLTPFEVSVCDVLLNTYRNIIGTSKYRWSKGRGKENEYYWQCVDVLHELPLPIDNALRQMRSETVGFLLMLMAIIHDGLLLKSVIDDARSAEKGELRTCIWKSLARDQFKFHQSPYGMWLKSWGVNGVVPISTTMVQVTRYFGTNAIVPDFIRVSQSFGMKVEILENGKTISIKRTPLQVPFLGIIAKDILLKMRYLDRPVVYLLAIKGVLASQLAVSDEDDNIYIIYIKEGEEHNIVQISELDSLPPIYSIYRCMEYSIGDNQYYWLPDTCIHRYYISN